MLEIDPLGFLRICVPLLGSLETPVGRRLKMNRRNAARLSRLCACCSWPAATDTAKLPVFPKSYVFDPAPAFSKNLKKPISAERYDLCESGVSAGDRVGRRHVCWPIADATPRIRAEGKSAAVAGRKIAASVQGRPAGCSRPVGDRKHRDVVRWVKFVSPLGGHGNPVTFPYRLRQLGSRRCWVSVIRSQGNSARVRIELVPCSWFSLWYPLLFGPRHGF